MTNPKLSDIATEADWSFATTENLAIIRGIARRAARNHEFLDEDDTFQELCLYLSVRPRRQRGKDLITSTCYRHIQDLSRQAQAETDREPSFEQIFIETNERYT